MTKHIESTPKTQLYNMSMEDYESIKDDKKVNWENLVYLMDKKFNIELEKGMYTNFDTIDFLEITSIMEKINFKTKFFELERLNYTFPNIYDVNSKKIKLKFQSFKTKHFKTELLDERIYDFELFKIKSISKHKVRTKIAEYLVDIDYREIQIIFTGIQDFISFENMELNYYIEKTDEKYINQWRNTHDTCIVLNLQKVLWIKLW